MLWRHYGATDVRLCAFDVPAAAPARDIPDAHPTLIASHIRACSPVLWAPDAFEGQHPVPIAPDALLPPPHPQPDALARWPAFASPSIAGLPLMDGIAPQAFDAAPGADAQEPLFGGPAANTLGISFGGDEWMSMV